MIKPRQVPHADRPRVAALVARIKRAERESPELIWAMDEARRAGLLPERPARP